MIMEKLVCSSAEFADTVENTIKEGGCVPLVVTGSSMAPFLIDGRDVVWLRACTDADFKRGKILLFRRIDGTVVLHRIRKVLCNDELLMNGDAQEWCEIIKRKQAVAAVTEIERNGQKRACSKNTLWHISKPMRPYLMGAWRRIIRSKR